ncbi:hypothetical protein [Acetobacter conturbans]|uniref:DUF4760 domain-containing protein n=1 Tax=Acetobacter conturbans TaxID=1737472 RepID=A0ABX0K1X7_9PROT|nr:hypothetical protein [Acetobacter conturbans]NHN89633.1 hypothetical protein [Acetobacter conturbans]
MSDVVVHLAGSDLTALLDHIPTATVSGWQTFVAVGTPIVTAATSIITACVLIANRKLTKDLAESNIILAKENKEISEKKLNLDMFNKRCEYIIPVIKNSLMCINFLDLVKKGDESAKEEIFNCRLYMKENEDVIRCLLSTETRRYFDAMYDGMRKCFHGKEANIYKFFDSSELSSHYFGALCDNIEKFRKLYNLFLLSLYKNEFSGLGIVLIKENQPE